MYITYITIDASATDFSFFKLIWLTSVDYWMSLHATSSRVSYQRYEEVYRTFFFLIVTKLLTALMQNIRQNLCSLTDWLLDFRISERLQKLGYKCSRMPATQHFSAF